MRYLLVFLFAVCFLFSCKDKIEVPLSSSAMDQSVRYFPLVKGSYIIYDVDSTIHETADDSTSNPDSLISYYHYQVEEVIDSSFIDGTGNTAWYISRFRRDADSLPWYFINLWTANRNSFSAQRVEDNIRYIKLSFPVSVSNTWNGNAYNILPEEDYTYSSINAPLTIGGFSFDSSLTVLHDQEANALYTILKEEKYICGVGMAYKQSDSLNLNGLGQITNGIQFRETLNDYSPK